VWLGEVEIGQHFGLAVVDERGELRPFRPQASYNLAMPDIVHPPAIKRGIAALLSATLNRRSL
jgi:hypothetical protein